MNAVSAFEMNDNRESIATFSLTVFSCKILKITENTNT